MAVLLPSELRDSRGGGRRGVRTDCRAAAKSNLFDKTGEAGLGRVGGVMGRL